MTSTTSFFPLSAAVFESAPPAAQPASPSYSRRPWSAFEAWQEHVRSLSAAVGGIASVEPSATLRLFESAWRNLSRPARRR